MGFSYDKNAVFRVKYGVLAPTRGFEPPTCRLGEPTNTVVLALSTSQKHRIYKGFANIRCQVLNNEKQLKSGENRGVYWLPIGKPINARVKRLSSISTM